MRFTDVWVEIPDDEAVEMVRKKFYPEQVYVKGELERWANENGYVKGER